MAMRTLHVGLLVALGVVLGAGSLVAALRLQKVAVPEYGQLTGKGVQVKTLPPGDSAGRYEATVVAEAEGTYTAYMGELMSRASRDCSGRSFGVEDGTYGPDVDSLVPAGEKLRIVVSCNHDRLPNHRVVAADDFSLMHGEAPEGFSSKSGSQQLAQHQGNEKLAVEALLGGYLREVYTEQCEGKAVLVRYIATASSPGTPSKHLPNPESMQATMHYQCVDAAPAVAGG